MSSERREKVIGQIVQKYGQNAEAPVREVVEFYEDVVQEIESERDDAVQKLVTQKAEELDERKQMEDMAEIGSEKTAKVVSASAQMFLFLGLGLGLLAGYFGPDYINMTDIQVIFAIGGAAIAVAYYYAKMQGHASWI